MSQRPGPYHAVVFDMDGVLVDSEPAFPPIEGADLVIDSLEEFPMAIVDAG